MDQPAVLTQKLKTREKFDMPNLNWSNKEKAPYLLLDSDLGGRTVCKNAKKRKIKGKKEKL